MSNEKLFYRISCLVGACSSIILADNHRDSFWWFIYIGTAFFLFYNMRKNLDL
jgi:hypothetical protein